MCVQESLVWGKVYSMEGISGQEKLHLIGHTKMQREDSIGLGRTGGRTCVRIGHSSIE